MNKQELIEEFKKIGVYNLNIFGTEIEGIPTKSAICLIEQLDEPEKGHADEAPRYVKNILARLRELPLHDREVWLKAIMGEFERDFSRAKWREGYEQGKFEGMIERDKVAIPQFVADWIEECGIKEKSLLTAILYTPEKVNSWVGDSDNQGLFARAWLDGYTIEEKRYKVKMKAIKSNSQYLIFGQLSGTWWFGSAEQIGNVKSEHTHKELEDAGFGEVFNSTLFEVEEVEE